MILDFYLLIPCYNNAEGLIRSLRSVVYPKEKCSVLIVDDGSETAVTAALIPEEIHQVLNIEIIRLANNQGITAALNTGLRIILNRNDSLFTARLDCGDTCSADRFYKQINYLSANTNIALVGSLCRFIDLRNKIQFIYRSKIIHADILLEMHWKCSFIHSTVVFRNSILKKTDLYPYNYPHAEDYALFFQLTKDFTTHILEDVLVDYEINTKGISITNRQKQIRSKIRIIKQYGTHKHLIFLGLAKQFLLLTIPYRLSYFSKRILYRNNLL